MVKAIVPDAVSTALREKLKLAVSRVGSVPKFAELSGIPKDTLNKYIAGAQPGPGALIRIADAAGMTVDALLGRSVSGSAGDLITNVFGLKPADLDAGVPEGFVAVPFLEVRASAGPGRVSLPGETVAGSHFLFSQAWLRSLHVTPQHAELLQAQGDSMYPTIHDGDLMLVDRGYGEVVHGKIYALVVGGLVVVKRVNMLAIGGMVLISDNERYPSETVRRDEVENLSFQGRVAWYGRAM